jgi:hypothetical protein
MPSLDGFSFSSSLLLDLLARLWQQLNPPPISPLFQASGPLHSLHEDFALIAFGLALLGVVDQVRPYTPFNHPKARYFFLHTFANALISFACLPDLQRALYTPVEALVGPTLTAFPMAMVAAIHIYHCLFFGLSRDDIFHHVQFVLPLIILSIVFKWDGGASQNFGAFFICGLPGGLNYAALCLVKEGWITPLTQKHFDAWINACLRAPGCIIYAFLQYQVWLADVRPTRGWSRGTIAFFTFVVSFLMAFNGVYYMEQSIGNYHEAKIKQKLGVPKEEAPPASGGGSSGSTGAGAVAVVKKSI